MHSLSSAASGWVALSSQGPGAPGRCLALSAPLGSPGLPRTVSYQIPGACRLVPDARQLQQLVSSICRLCQRPLRFLPEQRTLTPLPLVLIPVRQKTKPLLTYREAAMRGRSISRVQGPSLTICKLDRQKLWLRSEGKPPFQNKTGVGGCRSGGGGEEKKTKYFQTWPSPSAGNSLKISSKHGLLGECFL